MEYNIISEFGRSVKMSHKIKPILATILPCYNEEEILEKSFKALHLYHQELIENGLIDAKSFILFVDDGSVDATWQLIKKFTQESQLVKGIKLSRNQGHQIALLAGMRSVYGKCDCMVSIDADLQQDYRAIEKMLNRYKEGYEIVLGIRNDRESDSFFKRFTAESYYKLMHLMGVDIEFNHADFRLLSHKALGYFVQFPEHNLFIRGIVKLIGLPTAKVYFDVKEREAGESKYTLKKMLAFAWDGITSFSIVPLKLITLIGFIIFLISIGLGVDALYTALFTNKAIPGWASTVLPMYFMGGIELLAIGIIGEYIGKIYTEVKRRPHYFIEEEIL